MTDAITLTRSDDDDQLIATRGGDPVGHADYAWEEGGAVMNVTYVFVDPSQRGRGVGAQICGAIADLARGEGFRVRLTCGYAAGVFARTPALQDVLARA